MLLDVNTGAYNAAHWAVVIVDADVPSPGNDGVDADAVRLLGIRLLCYSPPVYCPPAAMLGYNPAGSMVPDTGAYNTAHWAVVIVDADVPGPGSDGEQSVT